MIYAGNRTTAQKLMTAWKMAEESQVYPVDALDVLFSHYGLVEADVQFSGRSVPEGRWFIDWGVARERYGGYELLESGKYGHVCRSKLASALCPECQSPIFSVILPNGNGSGRHKVQQLCLSCGHWDMFSLPRQMA